MIMKILEIKAYSFADAKEQAAAQGLTVVKNVTGRYKNRAEAITDDPRKEFCEKCFVDDKMTETTGSAYIVVVEKGSEDVRERPYKFNNIVTEGQLTKKRVFEIKTADGKVVATAESKGEASRVAKNAMKEVKEDLVCEQVYRVDNDHKTAFTLDYVPSKGTKLGTYIVFGN